MEYPTTLPQFEEQFGTEEACRQYLYGLRWPDGFRCTRCEHDAAWSRSNGLFECARCGYQVSVTAGTIFQDTKKPLRMWFNAIWHVTSQKYGANAMGLQRIMGFGSYRTAWSWLHKLRRAMVRPGRDRLMGHVQVDETFVGAEKSGKRGRGASGKTLILIATETNDARIGRIRMKTIVDASAISIHPAIESMVALGTTIETDGWCGYKGIDGLGFHHIKPSRRISSGDDMLPACHRVASLLKRWLLGTHQGSVGRGHLDYYLDEFTFRFNRRKSKSRGHLFRRLLEQAVAIEPTTVKMIVKQGQSPDYKIL
jgi:transposase-like protein